MSGEVSTLRRPAGQYGLCERQAPSARGMDVYRAVGLVPVNSSRVGVVLRR